MAETCKQPYPGDIYQQKASVTSWFNGIEEVRQVRAGGCKCEQILPTSEALLVS